MDLITLVQTLHRECRLSGSAPTAVTGLSGRAADLLRWTIEAYNDIQRDKDGQWKWLRKDWQVDTVADTQSYLPGAVTDVEDSAVISRFRAWDLNEETPPFIYLVSDGKQNESELNVRHWSDFRRQFVRATHTSSAPTVISASPDDKLYFGPTPSGVYRATGSYWRSNQTLAADADVPEMPADYHMLIVWQAIQDYGYTIVAQDILARAATKGAPLYEALTNNQWYGKQNLRWPDALA